MYLYIFFKNLFNSWLSVSNFSQCIAGENKSSELGKDWPHDLEDVYT